MNNIIEDLGKAGIIVADWDIRKKYPYKTFTVDYSTWISYISRKPVPVNTPITDINYWKPVIKPNKEMRLWLQDIDNKINSFLESIGGTAFSIKFGDSNLVGICQKALTEAFDGEDLCVKDDLYVKFADKDYNIDVASGLGRVYLRKNPTYIYASWLSIRVNGTVYLMYYDKTTDTLYGIYNEATGKGLILLNNLVAEKEDYNISELPEEAQSNYIGYTENNDIYTITLPDESTITSTELNQTRVYRYEDEKTVMVNILTKSMINKPNTIYHIQYDFDLDGDTITLPENCMLQFDGGSINNGTLQGYVVNDYLRPEWFGAKRDGVTDDTVAIQQCVDLMNVYGGTVLLNRGYYLVSHIDLKTKTNLKGAGIGSTIIKSATASEKGIINIVENSIQVIVSDLSIVGNKTQDGIYCYAVATIEGATYPMAYYLQEHTGIENNKQTYRNITVENVYVGHCNYGMNLNNRAYRTVVQKCDVKYCVYGINFLVTDSDIHNIYIEHCDRSGLICKGSNNNVTDIKSIWNGIVAPYSSFGAECRGNRNRYVNIEVQDNYCSGVASSGNENIYSNIIANGDGYAYDAELDDANDGLCEWYVNTLTSTYKNCVVTNYSTRQSEAGVYDKPFPKYPIKYGADGIGTGADITILGSTSGTWLAREPINIPDIIQSDNYFNIKPAKITAAPQYGYLVDEVFTSQQFKREFITSGQLTLIFEFTLGDIQFQDDIRVDLYGSPKLSIAFSEGKNLHILRNSTTIRSISCGNADVTKPIRICTTITPRYKSGNSWYYDIGLYIWYYDTELGVYRFATSRYADYAVAKTTASQSIRKVVFGDDQNGNLSNAFYLRTFMIAEKHGIPSSISYPNALISHLEHFFGFDFRSLNGLQRMDVGNTANRPNNLGTDEYVSKGFQYFNTDFNLPQWWNGQNYITPVVSDGIEITPDEENPVSLKDYILDGTYTWASSGVAQYITDWPTDIDYATGSMFVMHTASRLIQILIINSASVMCMRIFDPNNDTPNSNSWYKFGEVFRPSSVAPQLNIRKGLTFFNTDINKPSWFDGVNWITPWFSDADFFDRSNLIEIAPTAGSHDNLLNYKTFGKYKIGSGTIAGYIDDWPTEIPTASALMIVMPNGSNNYITQILIANAYGLIAIRTFTSTAVSSAWYVIPNAKRGISVSIRPSYGAANIGACVFDNIIKKPIWWDGTKWILADGSDAPT